MLESLFTSIFTMESKESVWSDFHQDSTAFQFPRGFDWHFQMEPDPFILQSHLQLVKYYYGFEADAADKIEREMKEVSVIETPRQLFQRHLTTNPIDIFKALDLAKLRIDSGATDITTIFGDPFRFYDYKTIDLIVAEKPTDCYSVVPRTDPDLKSDSKSYFKPDGGDLNAIHLGEKWAIFERKSGNVLHFNAQKWAEIRDS